MRNISWWSMGRRVKSGPLAHQQKAYLPAQKIFLLRAYTRKRVVCVVPWRQVMKLQSQFDSALVL